MSASVTFERNPLERASHTSTTPYPHHRLGASSHSTVPYTPCRSMTGRDSEMRRDVLEIGAEMCRDVPRCAAWCLASVREPFQHTYFLETLSFPANINYFNPSPLRFFFADPRTPVRGIRKRNDSLISSYFPGQLRCSRCIKFEMYIFTARLLAVSETADSMVWWTGAGARSVVVARFRATSDPGPMCRHQVHLVSRTCDDGVRLDHNKIFPRTANSSHHPTNGNGARG